MSVSFSLSSSLRESSPCGLARQFLDAWQQGARPDVRSFLADQAEVSLAELAAVLRVDQRQRWLLGERVPAEDYLREFLPLEASAEHALDLVYAEFLLRDEVGANPTLDEFASRFPHFAEALRLQIDLHRALAASGSGERKTVPAAAAEDGLADGVTVDGYEVVGVLGHGGMGIVYKAWQKQLKRWVALKMIRGGPERPREDHSRFRAEYEILARLRHPNIVQIYEAGEKDCCPFFSLELVEGGSLDRQLAGRPQPPAAAAELVRTLAGAVHHAHGAGVIHRDLKPSNVLLASGGRCVTPVCSSSGGLHPPLAPALPPLAQWVPKITDFGLAKLVRQEDAGAQTLSGQVMGTPCYLSPEQAAGSGREAGPAADIYSLGAILYELLAGRPPFQAATLLETLDQVRSREPLPPSRLVPGLPRDLETICLKCLQKEPHRRYASAAALADDLDRFLAGRPILARPTPVWERAAKWARRRPAVALLLLALTTSLLALSGLGAWSYVRIRQARDDAEEGRRSAEAARTEAEMQTAEASRRRTEAVRKGAEAKRGTLLALEAVYQFWTQVSEEALLNRPGMENVRRAFLKQALDFYEKAIREGGDDPDLRGARGGAYLHYAQLTALMETPEQPLQRARLGQAILAELVREFPRHPVYRSDLVRSHVQIANLLSRIGQFDAARADFDEALRQFAALPDDQRQTARQQQEIADAHFGLALLHKDAHRLKEAEDSLRTAESLRLALLRDGARALEDKKALGRCRSGVALTQTELANLYTANGRTREAEKPCRDALVVYRALARSDRRNVRYQVDLGRGQLSLGSLLAETRRPDPAVEAFSDAIDIFEKLVEDFASILEYKQMLAVALVNRSSALRELGKHDEAEAGHRKALTLYAALVQANPRMAEYPWGQAAARANLAMVLRDRGKLPEALACLTRSIGDMEELLGRHPRYGPARGLLIWSVTKRAGINVRLGRLADALKDWERALERTSGPPREDLLTARAITLAQLGEHERAAAEAEKLAAPKTTPPERLYNLAGARLACSAAAFADRRLGLAGSVFRARTHADAALALLRRARATGWFQAPANRERLKTDPTFNALRPNADFQRLLRSVAAGAGE